MAGCGQVDKIKVKMFPSLSEIDNNRSGIATVIRVYHRLADDFGIEFVDAGHDLAIVHGGMGGRAALVEQCDIAMLHGIYFTAEYPALKWEWKTNSSVIKSIVNALSVTSPSDWVAATLRREFKIDPYLLDHGVFFQEWAHNKKYNPRQIFWGKNRIFTDVCDPTSLLDLAVRMPEYTFITTLAPRNAPDNVIAIGVLDEDDIKRVVQESAIVLSTIRETWGILYMEAMAAGTPVVSANVGHVPKLAPHGVASYCYAESNLEDMERGVRWALKNRDVLSKNSIWIAKQYPWENSMRTLRQILEVTRRKKDAIYLGRQQKA